MSFLRHDWSSRYGATRERELYREIKKRITNETTTVEYATELATAARHYAAIRLALRASGRPIPANDVWIAALALQHGLPIVSRDSHFDQVENIERINWSK